jgi:hypothetical protein
VVDLTNKTICVLLHGSSLNELESKIEEFRNINVVWCGINYFNPSEEILKKIDKSFNIIFDCSTVQNNVEYEKKARLPRLIEFLERKNTTYITLKSGRDNLYDLRNRIGSDFNEKYKNQIVYGENLGFDCNQFCVSLHLYLTCLLKLGAKTIILFGADGGGNLGNSVSSYYKPELMQEDKVIAGNTSYNMTGDTCNVNNSFNSIMQSIFGQIPTILNCSPNSQYTVFKNVNFNQVLKEIKNGANY